MVKILLPPLEILLTSERLGFELPLPQAFPQGPPVVLGVLIDRLFCTVVCPARCIAKSSIDARSVMRSYRLQARSAPQVPHIFLCLRWHRTGLPCSFGWNTGSASRNTHPVDERIEHATVGCVPALTAMPSPSRHPKRHIQMRKVVCNQS